MALLLGMLVLPLALIGTLTGRWRIIILTDSASGSALVHRTLHAAREQIAGKFSESLDNEIAQLPREAPERLPRLLLALRHVVSLTEPW
jgi:hypothetical protein